MPGEGARLLYAGGHCHAPSCTSIELWRNDTGTPELLCRQASAYGKGQVDVDRFDELKEVVDDINLKKKLWDSLRSFGEQTITWTDTKFDELDADAMEEEVANAINDKDQYQQELEYIKREDVLDEAGRQRPIMIQSTDSDLVDRLQVNEFLYEAQQARNPVPPMIEKIAQLLAMLHEGQDRSDQCLADLSKSNSLEIGRASCRERV